MRPILLLTLAMTVTGTLSLAQATPQERWEGYRAADSAEVRNLNLPFQGFIDNAVFEMETVGFTANPGEQFVREDLQNPSITHPNEAQTLQIETCRNQGLRYCPVYTYTTNATTFFNRGRFITCRHSFHNWISLASQWNNDLSVSRISPPMILRNRTGRVVYNSANANRPQMRLSFINNDVRLNYQTHEHSYPSRSLTDNISYADYVEMTLNESIVPRDYALVERSGVISSHNTNSEFFALGFEKETNPRDPTYSVSNGYFSNFDGYFVNSSNYVSPGMSGGPLVTTHGELAGVTCRGDHSGSAALPLDHQLMRTLWSIIPYPSEQELALLQQGQTTSTNVSQ